MKINKVHCFFEQSGTFKNEFKKLGIDAEDYDILNDFNETDNVVDLFIEIENAYNGGQSLFDCIKEDDLIFAFFPCIRFSRRFLFNFITSGTRYGKFDDIDKLEKNIRYFNEMNYMYSLISKLVIVCLRKSIRLIIENPYHEQHILSQFWHLKPKLIDFNRTKRGDFFKKPTMYWFINCDPEYNFIMEAQIVRPIKTIAKVYNKVERSLISKEYANRFIREFIL